MITSGTMSFVRRIYLYQGLYLISVASSTAILYLNFCSCVVYFITRVSQTICLLLSEPRDRVLQFHDTDMAQRMSRGNSLSFFITRFCWRGRKCSSINGSSILQAYVRLYTCPDVRSKRGERVESSGSAASNYSRRCQKDVATITRTSHCGENSPRQRHWHSGTSSRLKAAHLWPSKHRQIKGWIHV